jgi:hypothetical protein
MGKKTDKFIQDISAASEKCMRTCGILEKLSKAMDENGDKWTSKVEAEMRQLGDWEKHPVAIERDKIWQKGKDLRQQLRNEVNEIYHSIGDFKKYIAKKEKSKNPFKSKKSLPAAKEMVGMFDKVQGEFETVLTKMGSAFR